MVELVADVALCWALEPYDFTWKRPLLLKGLGHRARLENYAQVNTPRWGIQGIKESVDTK